MSEFFDQDENDPDIGNPMVAKIERESVMNEYREIAIEKMRKFLDPALRIIKSYPNLPLAFDCFLLASGKFDILGVDNQEALAVNHRCTPANINKLVIKFQKQLGLPKIQGQRTDEGRAKMRNVRKSKLK